MIESVTSTKKVAEKTVPEGLFILISLLCSGPQQDDQEAGVEMKH